MKCSVCRLTLELGFRFCPACGQEIDVSPVELEESTFDVSPDRTDDDAPSDALMKLRQILDEAKTNGGAGLDDADESNGEESFEPPSTDKKLRAQVFEVIVRQAISGAPWRDICLSSMLISKISFEEVEEEVRRRGFDPGPATPGPPFTKSDDDQGHGERRTERAYGWSAALKADSGPPASFPNNLFDDEMIEALFAAEVGGWDTDLSGIKSPVQRLQSIRETLKTLVDTVESEATKVALQEVLRELDRIISTITSQQSLLDEIEQEAQLQRDLDREIERRARPVDPDDDRDRFGFT